MAAVQNDNEFKFRCELIGHSKDVRALAEINLGQNKSIIVSGSRDLTVRFWDEKDESHFSETHCAKGHTNYIGAVAFMAPPPGSSGSCTSGKAFSGSNDGSIRAYDAETADFLYVLNGHQSAVTCLAADETRQMLISGSADTTVIIWHDEQCLQILAGHLLVVWAIFVVPSESTCKKLPTIISGSADKTIQLWSDGTSVKTYTGHKDCVRALVPVNQNEFLSASNDATIKRWNTKTGNCLMTYSGHDGFIYSIAFNPSYNYFVTSAEDKSIRIWSINSSSCLQTIYVPAQSVWSVILLPNGDIACGSSDAAIRIFTREPTRVAKPDVLAAYDEQVKAFCTATSSGEIGGIKITDLPSIEALRQIGTKEGQTKMIRIGDKVELYSWSDSKAKWEKVGDVLGSKEPNDGKKMYLGKEYDYVFDVDIEDGKPTLKLPYNMNEDPWVVAQKFIHDNFLPQSYLDTVSNFITTNAAATNVGAAPNPADHATDPLTGAGRYIPGHIENNTTSVGSFSDPFTGTGRYVPMGTDLSKVDSKRPRGENIPLNDYITFSSSAGLLLGKLKESNAQVFETVKLNEKQLQVVENLIATKQCQAEDIVEPLSIMLRWPKQHQTPCLDILRLALLNKPVADYYFSQISRGKEFADKLCRLIHEGNAPAQFRILVPRCFANSLNFESSRICLISISEIICRVLIEKCLFYEKPAAHIATAACLANFSFAFLKIPGQNLEKKKEFSKQLFEGINKNSNQLGQNFDQQALFYLLQCFVTLLWGDDEIVKLADENNMKLIIEKLKDVSYEEKSKIIARCIERML